MPKQTAMRPGVQLESWADGLAFREDGFSRQVSFHGDRLFWWRMELAAPSRPIVTDFNPGNQDDRLMSHCLALLLGDLNEPGPLQVRFIDLVPHALEPAQHRIQLNTVMQRLDLWIRQSALLLARSVNDPVLDRTGRKICLTAEFGAEG